jgi:hypothetical protein
VNPVNCTRSPILHSFGGVNNSTVLCSASDAANTIACDLIPRKLAGFILINTTTKRLIKSSNGINAAKPDTTIRGVASPISISSTYNESASGCLYAFKIRPTRKSNLDISLAAGTGADLPPLTGTGLAVLASATGAALDAPDFSSSSSSNNVASSFAFLSTGGYAFLTNVCNSGEDANCSRIGCNKIFKCAVTL